MVKRVRAPAMETRRSNDRSVVAWCLGCAIAGLVGCQHAGDPGAQVEGPERAGQGPQSAPLRDLADEYWNQRMEANPLEATEFGDHRFDDRLPDISPAARAAGPTGRSPSCPSS